MAFSVEIRFVIKLHRIRMKELGNKIDRVNKLLQKPNKSHLAQ